MKFSVATAFLGLASSAMAAVTIITATNEGNVYTKTIELADTDATLAEGQYLTSIVVTRGDTVYTKVITESSSAAAAETTSAAPAETTSAAPAETTSAAAETTSVASAETTSVASAETTSAVAETTSSSAAAQATTADVSTYTGGAALASVGTGLLGVAVAGLLI
ncbi:unnamed protein product [Kluyveromyces dobzhanskii CBS 2104]|uniref:WGS project CCBQ000000000 data, contig MAT n=1 Tax=Kluyveromyces dobzhanskii CBS 2104 TaxID=1427455 RepID=A0A0A8L3V2_9SACH|nr:unnamed protein product [Kluyveromyces dobzhanskii CBS 2104]